MPGSLSLSGAWRRGSRQPAYRCRSRWAGTSFHATTSPHDSRHPIRSRLGGHPMARAARICPKPGCPKIVARRYCADHDREYEAKRGTAHQRGYGIRHQSLRGSFQGAINGGLIDCWRCGQPIRPGDDWDLGHDDDDRTITRGPEHAYCNRSAAGRKGRRLNG